MESMGGIVWSLAIVGGPIVLALGLAYGIFQWHRRSRNPALKAARDEATREAYESEPHQTRTR